MAITWIIEKIFLTTGACMWVVAVLFVSGFAWHRVKQWWIDATGGER